MHRSLFIVLLLLPVCGCSTLGLSLFPSGSFLTDQAEEVLACSPSSADLPRELHRTVLPVHYLEPGDELLIEPADFDSAIRLPADQRVMADGSLDLGRFGRAVVAGLTVEDAEKLVEQTIENQIEVSEQGNDAKQDGVPKKIVINIRLLEPVHRFYVLGAVNSPGSYPLTGYETVLDGILAAGGLTSDASMCKMLLARPTTPCSCRVTLPICYREITQLGDTTTNYQLQPGDRIFVSTRSCLEELMFWKATETCERCCKCQSPSAYPQSVTTMVPVTPGMLGLANASPMIEQNAGSPAARFMPGVPSVSSETIDAPGKINKTPKGSSSQLAPLLEGSPFEVHPPSSSDVLDGQLDFSGPMPSLQE
ncbi:SLBB domain protein [Novipirellula aureliae]|uniref:SLBB domain protein n=1 Tax=Novipirellula aureliae TaxID=2527966 RepID=A0A5C6E512_9BACT|nr:SLBB domain-containing protein [Novipirellula aureliae]TWU43940.1 SLBB domain protein [Novipirellula aureliae]